MLCFLHISPTGDKNIINSFGPKEDPWGTPCFTEVNSEHPVVGSLPFASITMHCVQSVR